MMMPLYEYKCKECGSIIKADIGYLNNTTYRCPHCGCDRFVRLPLPLAKQEININVMVD